MAHECDDCGESFETLTRLRLHDCGSTQSNTPVSTPNTGDLTPTVSSSTGDSNTTHPELDDLLDQFADGDVDVIHHAVVEFESALSTALEEDDSGDSYRDLFWPYYERISDSLDDATRTEGWALLADVISAYDPTVDEELPHATPAIANAVGRYLIRTRVNEGVEAIPVEALEYLDSVAVNADDTDDIAREEVHAYGWGIGHPDHSVVDRLHDRLSTDITTVTPSLEHAFYADQYAAVDALERLVREETADQRYLLDCVYGLKTDDYWPKMPRYYDWGDELDYSFEVAEPVEHRIHALVEEIGLDAHLPSDWSFRDLGI
jgi:hypothetical protein